MRFVLTILLFLQGWLFAAQTDYDVTVVGTSPISMLETIYHLSKDERVLILEADAKCGGAWKSIDICGIANVDLGCHLIGTDLRLKEFFEKYFGCKFVCLKHPDQEAVDSHSLCTNGFYFSHGCYELISHLQAVIRSCPNAVLLHRKLESIFIDSSREMIEVSLEDSRFTTSKLVLTPSIQFRIENPSFTNQEPRGHLYSHLYLLVEDETPSRFTYLSGIVSGMSRAMNLTPFLEFPRDNLQLIVIQTHKKSELNNCEQFLDALKDQGYLSPHARILTSDTYFYQQYRMNTTAISHLAGPLVEILDTTSFAGMVKYLDKWKSVMEPLRQ
jgi:hypothetical protein